MKLANLTRRELLIIANRLGIIVYRHDTITDIKKQIQKAERQRKR